MRQKLLDVPRIIRSLEHGDVRYVVVGGIAAVTHGAAAVTYDADIAIAYTPENIPRVVAALKPLDPKPPRLQPGAAWVWDEKSIAIPWSIFDTDAGRVDLLARLPGVESFDQLYERSLVLPLGDTQIRIASLEDLIAMKRVSDRTKDKLHLLQLEGLFKLRDERSLP